MLKISPCNYDGYRDFSIMRAQRFLRTDNDIQQSSVDGVEEDEGFSEHRKP